jgi:uncharacterized protein (TIGR03437 family)
MNAADAAMEENMKRFLALAALVCPSMMAQDLDEPVVLKIEVENHVLYRGSVFDAAQIGKDPGPVSVGAQVPFVDGINIGDIVAINGQPAKGIWSSSFTHTTPYRAAPQPGQFIADFDSGATFFCTWQIYAPDGTFLGMIRDSGAAQGHAITGTLGGYFGAIGTHTATQTVPNRVTTTAEDPANRRKLGGGKITATFYLYPRFRPAVVVSASGPAVAHADFSPVTAASPARPGETLIVAATGLGPVKPNLEPPGAVQFADSPLQEVNGPVSVVFNGKELPVTNKVGWPGQKTVYRIDFQVPSDASAETATLGFIASWIPGPTVTIPVGAR